uniref:BZIP domain-containing protein n=1 Tax=Heterorhabditis bacteriophora TaxID=37862 RepID=A0A1I7WYP8_HETBA
MNQNLTYTTYTSDPRGGAPQGQQQQSQGRQPSQSTINTMRLAPVDNDEKRISQLLDTYFIDQPAPSTSATWSGTHPQTVQRRAHNNRRRMRQMQNALAAVKHRTRKKQRLLDNGNCMELELKTLSNKLPLIFFCLLKLLIDRLIVCLLMNEKFQIIYALFLDPTYVGSCGRSPSSSAHFWWTFGCTPTGTTSTNHLHNWWYDGEWTTRTAANYKSVWSPAPSRQRITHLLRQHFTLIQIRHLFRRREKMNTLSQLQCYPPPPQMYFRKVPYKVVFLHCLQALLVHLKAGWYVVSRIFYNLLLLALLFHF